MVSNKQIHRFRISAVPARDRQRISCTTSAEQQVLHTASNVVINTLGSLKQGKAPSYLCLVDLGLLCVIQVLGALNVAGHVPRGSRLTLHHTPKQAAQQAAGMQQNNREQ